MGLVERREDPGRQRLQGRLLLLGKQRRDLLAHGAVNPRVRDPQLPLVKELVLFGQARKAPTLERVVLDVLHARLDLALVLRRARLGRENHCAVMPGKTRQLGIEFRIEPVGLQHRRLEVVGDHGLRHAAEMPEGVFQTAQKTLRVLPPDHLAVAFPRKAQRGPEQVWPASFALGDHRGALAEVHLHLLPGRGLDAPERQRGGVAQSVDKAFDRVVAPRESVVGDQILMDAYRAQPLDQPRSNDLTVGLAETAGPGGHFGWFCLCFSRRAGGHFGRF